MTTRRTVHRAALTLFATIAMGLAPTLAPAQPRSPDLVIVGRLLARTGPVPHCGVVHFTELMEYEVISVEQGASSQPRVLVVQSCPEMPTGTVRGFTVGDVHRLELSRTITVPQPAGTLGTPGQPRFQALRTDQATP